MKSTTPTSIISARKFSRWVICTLAGCALAIFVPTASATAPVSSIQGDLTVTSTAGSDWLVVYADLTLDTTLPVDPPYYYEIPYQLDSPFTLTDIAGSPLTLSDVGFFTSPTEIPLDNLNISDSENPPPPGTGGSPFDSLPSYFDKTLGANGGSETVNVPDAASTLTLSEMALLGLQACKRRFAMRSSK